MNKPTKAILLVLLIVLMAFSLSACQEKQQQQSVTPDTLAQVQSCINKCNQDAQKAQQSNQTVNVDCNKQCTGA